LPAEPVAPEPGAIALLSRRFEQSEKLVLRVGRWWMAADFHRRQLPVLVLALGVWAISARSAWQSQESGTPLLRESISQMRQAQARAAMSSSPAAGDGAAPAALTRSLSTSAKSQSPSPVSARPAATLERTGQNSGGNFADRLLTSIDSLFDPEPTTPEKVEGNPQRRVWVDLKTGLYYCPGADYYGFGGRDRGKVMSQRAAEYDYFQPASGAPCE
jgi:hypothetical protein